MSREIILPPHLYDRIKATAGEHGGIGGGSLFDECGAPLCAHGHAWGTEERYRRSEVAPHVEEPELAACRLGWIANDVVVEQEVGDWDKVIAGARISFDRWCELLDVKRGVASEVDFELAVDKRSVFSGSH